MILTKNVFDNNFAKFGGGGIYFKNKILKESPYIFNKFNGNKAYFANDFYTLPTRVRFQDDKNLNFRYGFNMVPGFTNIKMKFYVVDYYGQTIKLLNRY